MTADKSHLDNSPNARKLLDSLRYLGYDNLYAISDLVDNAVDAGAQHIWVNVERSASGDFTIQIADDGCGMPSPILDQASRLGSEVSRNAASDLGRFGMGLVTASLSLGKRLTILTRSDEGPVLVNVTDFDHMTKANSFVRERFGKAGADEQVEFDAAITHLKKLARARADAAERAGRKVFYQVAGDRPTGTVVRITKCDVFKRKYVKPFEKELERHLGQAYRMFIRAGRAFYINQREVPVEINDPLWLDHHGTTLHSDETYDLKYTDAEGNEICDPVQIRLAILPDHGGPDLNKQHGYNVQRSGLYLLRNNREIAPAQLLGLAPLSRHPDFIRFRGEVFVTGRLDDALGIEFTKRDVKPTQSIRDQLDELIGGDIKSIRSRLKKQRVKTEGTALDYTATERLIESKAGLLIKPPVRPGPAAPPDRTDTPLGTVKFGTGNFGREGPIYAAEQVGRTTRIEWNADHPFYERFALANRNDREVLNAANSLVFCMAVAELRVFDEDHQHFVDAWKQILSANLRTLLS